MRVIDDCALGFPPCMFFACINACDIIEGETIMETITPTMTFNSVRENRVNGGKCCFFLVTIFIDHYVPTYVYLGISHYGTVYVYVWVSNRLFCTSEYSGMYFLMV